MDRNDVFRPVITEMKDTNTNIYGPSSFLDYLKANNLPRVRTPEYLSIDSFDRLPAILRENDTMILRLGSSLDSNQTNFALMKVKNKLHDFFLFDDEIFNQLTHIFYINIRCFFRGIISNYTPASQGSR